MLAPLLALALAAAPPCALPPLADGERPWRTGETLELELDVLGAVKAGLLQLSVERPMSGGRIVPLRARARTTAALASIRRFVGVGLSWVDAATLLPERYRDDMDENGVRKSSDARMPGDGRVTIAYRQGDRESEARFDAAGEVLDALSALYYLRAARLAPGDRFCFDAVASRRLWHLEGTVAAEREAVETPAGRFETFRVDALARRADRPEARPRPVHLWFTRDSRRLLVAAVSEIELGPVRAQLAAVRGTRAAR
ncbi:MULTISPECIES: DUF3108 domain-containing protein [Anaeromyxobacter]|uniref:DUF3108 domain-containing protein n=1 Tax=Anaeromyxobacter TaxID=161492 RepID=UPI001F58BD0E|nr:MULTISPECIES: DUF3108 domain-containing protein [unclassified Anaeromyxobacter]